MLNPGRSQVNRDKLVIPLPDPRICPADLSPLSPQVTLAKAFVAQSFSLCLECLGMSSPTWQDPLHNPHPPPSPALTGVTSSVSSHSTLPLASSTPYRLHHGHSFPHLSPLLDRLSTSPLTPALSLVLRVGQYACSSDCTALSGIHFVRTTELWTVDPL